VNATGGHEGVDNRHCKIHHRVGQQKVVSRYLSEIQAQEKQEGRSDCEPTDLTEADDMHSPGLGSREGRSQERDLWLREQGIHVAAPLRVQNDIQRYGMASKYIALHLMIWQRN